MVDPRTPVIVAAGQVSRRPSGEPQDAVDLMVEATIRAADGAEELVRRAQLVVAIRGDWRLADPARVVADRVGATRARTASTPQGGNMPQHALSELARRIAAGELDVGIVVGGEDGSSQRMVGQRAWSRRPEGPAADERIGESVRWWTDFEQQRGMRRPLEAYALVESSLAAASGVGLDAHRDRVTALWSRFNEVAAANPMAWSRHVWSREELRNGSSTNTMVMFPYTRAMVANPFVDQAAALIVCSVDAAKAAGIGTDRWGFPLASAHAHDTPDLAARRVLHESPAIRLSGQRALELAGVDSAQLLDDDLVDVYSCFPSAVQVAVAELGLDDQRALTLTGGLTFFGGPHSNYVGHSLVEMWTRLTGRRGASADDASALITANGGYLTKHCIAVYGRRPPAGGFQFESVQASVDAVPLRDVDPHATGEVTIEAAATSFSDGAPHRAVFACRTATGARTWGWSAATDVCAEACRRLLSGELAFLDDDGEVHPLGEQADRAPEP